MSRSLRLLAKMLSISSIWLLVPQAEAACTITAALDDGIFEIQSLTAIKDSHPAFMGSSTPNIVQFNRLRDCYGFVRVASSEGGENGNDQSSTFIFQLADSTGSQNNIAQDIAFCALKAVWQVNEGDDPRLDLIQKRMPGLEAELQNLPWGSGDCALTFVRRHSVDVAYSLSEGSGVSYWGEDKYFYSVPTIFPLPITRRGFVDQVVKVILESSDVTGRYYLGNRGLVISRSEFSQKRFVLLTSDDVEPLREAGICSDAYTGKFKNVDAGLESDVERYGKDWDVLVRELVSSGVRNIDPAVFSFCGGGE